jgi:hypothetical protein
MLPWLVLALGCAMIFAVQSLIWRRQTTIELSRIGWAIVVAASLAGAALAAWSYVRNSSSRDGVADQINLRERDRSAWLRRGVGSIVGLGILAGCGSAFALYQLVPHLAGDQTRRVGRVKELIVTPGSTSRCMHFVVVRFDDDIQTKLCTEDSLWSRRIMPEAIALQVGDPVAVTMNATLLGVSADLSNDVR